MEEHGNKYFNSLLRNSFFQDLEKDALEQVEFFKMHDLVKHVAGDRECFVFNSFENMECIISSVRRRLHLFIFEGNNFDEIMAEALDWPQS